MHAAQGASPPPCPNPGVARIDPGPGPRPGGARPTQPHLVTLTSRPMPRPWGKPTLTSRAGSCCAVFPSG
eukprot:364753-Chlamydomonas_euryale.AAC.4